MRFTDRKSPCVTQCMRWLGCLVAVVLLASDVAASPIISIGEGQATSWQDAINAGNIQPVLAADGLTQPAQDFYGGQAADFQLVDSIVYASPNVVLEGEGHDSLVMGWDPPGAGNLPIAA